VCLAGPKLTHGTDLSHAHTCIFCGPTESPLTEEHIWPKWVSEILRRSRYVDHFRHLHTAGPSTAANWKARYLDLTIETVCDQCNNRWLSAFENDEVKPMASPMIVGDSRIELSSANQRTLAAWAYKMALLIDVKCPKHETQQPFFTAADRLQFRRTTMAHPFVRVFLARYDFGQHPAHATNPCHTFTERFGQQRSFSLSISTLTAGSLALQVMAVRPVNSDMLVPASEMAFEFTGTAADAIIPIWPVTETSVNWPPALTMSVAELEDWTGMWIAAAQT
jgi:hypothetical protein